MTKLNNRNPREMDETSKFRRRQFERLSRKETFMHVFKIAMLIIAALLAILCAMMYKM